MKSTNVMIAMYLSDKNPYCTGTLAYHMQGIPLHGICQMRNSYILNLNKLKHYSKVNENISSTNYQHTRYQVFQSLWIERGDRGTDQSDSN